MPEKFNELLLKQDIIELYNAGITPDYGYLMNGRFEKDMVKTIYHLKTLSGNPISWEAREMEYLFPNVSLQPKQAGSGDPSPENVRPISGYDDVTVNVRGKNLLGGECLSASLITDNNEPSLTNSRGTTISSLDVDNLPIHVEQTQLGNLDNLTSYANGFFVIKTPEEIPDDAQLTISMKIRVTSALSQEADSFLPLVMGSLPLSKLPVNPTIQEAQTLTFTFKISEGKEYAPQNRLKQVELRIAGMSFDILEVQLELGSTPTPYEPYQPGTTAALSLPETIYGGTVDAVMGVGEKTWEFVEFDGTEDWVAGANGDRKYFTCIISRNSDEIPSSTNNEEIAKLTQESSHFTILNPYTTDVENCILVYSTPTKNFPHGRLRSTANFTTVEELKSYLAAQASAGTPVQVAYKLATPTSFQATGNQQLTSLLGYNTIYTNGESIKLNRKARRLEV